MQSKLLILAITTLMFSNCKIENKENIELRILDRFSNHQDNIQLGIDLINLKFIDFLVIDQPELNEKVLKNINWQYFIKDKNKEVSFKLILKNEALEQREKIIPFFESMVDEQLMVQEYQLPKFKELIDSTEFNLQLLDNEEFEKFYSRTSEDFKRNTTDIEFIQILENRYSTIKTLGKRILHTKQHYTQLPGSQVKDIWVICLKYEKDENAIEQITYKNSNQKYSIIGYDYRFPN